MRIAWALFHPNALIHTYSHIRALNIEWALGNIHRKPTGIIEKLCQVITFKLIEHEIRLSAANSQKKLPARINAKRKKKRPYILSEWASSEVFMCKYICVHLSYGLFLQIFFFFFLRVDRNGNGNERVSIVFNIFPIHVKINLIFDNCIEL